MKLAYLVFAYKNPRVLERTISALSCSACTFFVHIDKKSCIRDFSHITGKNIIFSPERLAVYWADFSGVEAVLLLLRQALASPEGFDYFVLLSGSEYPLQCREYIHEFFEENRGSEFISMVKVPNEAAGKPIEYFDKVVVSGRKALRRYAMRALSKLGLAKRDHRKFLGSLEPYAGSTWWALTRDASQYVLGFIDKNRPIVEFFQNVSAPEEAFFHTILGNSIYAPYVKRNLVYEDWTTRGSHPAMINDHHVALFESQSKVIVSDVYGSEEMLYARKLSDDRLDLLERIDKMIRRKASWNGRTFERTDVSLSLSGSCGEPNEGISGSTGII